LKLRSLLLAGAVAATLAPALSSHANQCDSPLYVFSRHRVQTDVDDPTTPAPDRVGRNLPGATSSAVGCTVARDTVFANDPTFEYLYDTDLIV
jgi:hypothetical protein